MGKKLKKIQKMKKKSPAEPHYSQANLEFKKRDFVATIKSLLAAIEADPKFYNSYIFASDIAREANNSDLEAKFLHAGEVHFPEDRDIMIRLALVYERVGRYELTLLYAQKMLSLFKGDPDAMILNAGALIFLNKKEEAVKCLERLIELRPSDIKAYEVLAGEYEMLVMNEELEALAKKAKSVFGEDVRMQLTAKVEFKNKRYQNVLDILDGYQAKGDKRAAGQASGLKAKAFEKLGMYNEAFESYGDCQSLMAEVNKNLVTGDMVSDLTLSNRKSYEGDSVIDFPAYEFDDGFIDPVFIVGFPRSGTTLTEQALFASGKFFVPDEVSAIMNAIMKGPYGQVGGNIDYPKSYENFSKEKYEVIRKNYFAFMEQKTGRSYDKSIRMADKLPSNIVNIGFIRSLFPKSKIIVVIRDPRDVCLSCFFQIFAHNNFMKRLYTLESTVNCYDDIMGLYLQYRRHFSGDLFELKYEDMVDDFEGGTKSMYSFIGEEWTEDVMQFYAKKRDVANLTPNYNSINKPVYKSSKHRWRNYEEQIKPFVPKLERYIKAFGYEV